jgi:molybdopterin synthase catalytic subunit
MIPTETSTAGRLETQNGIVVLTYDPLDVAQIIGSVGDDAAGATAVFVGTTRDSFKGKY